MDSLGDRMKGYENIERKYLTSRMPTIIRIDGRAFHSFTRGFRKPFDEILMKSMWDTATVLCKEAMGCKLAYVQSDEISLLLTDYDNLESQAWFDKNLQKIVSISASIATLAFNKSFIQRVMPSSMIVHPSIYEKRYNTATFDSRVFILPKEEVCNYFVWRQQDATRNAIQMVGHANFSHRQLQSKDCNEIQEMLFQEKGINFNDYPISHKRGVCIVKEIYMKGDIERTHWVADENIPIFTQNRDYVERYL